MTISNISTYGSLQTLLQNMSQSQNVLNNDEVEISSGQLSQTFDGISGSIEQLTALNSQISRLQNFQQSNTSYASQLSTTNTLLGQVGSLATGIQSLIGTQLSATSGSSTAFVNTLQQDLTTLTSQLNTTYAGNYLFGGADINTPPVKTPLPTPASYGTLSNSYYQGSAETTSTQIADDQKVSNSITAADPAFQNIIAGIQQAIQAAGSGDTAGLQNAETLVQTGNKGEEALQSTVGSNYVLVNNLVNNVNPPLITSLQGITQGMTQTNEVELSSKVAQDQVVLEATFQTYSRISSLSLVTYLPS